MKCNSYDNDYQRPCNTEMKFIACNDSPNEGWAYNVYHCDACGTLCKDNVWGNKERIWIRSNNSITTEFSPTKTPQSK